MDDIWVFGNAFSEKEIKMLMDDSSKKQLKKLHIK